MNDEFSNIFIHQYKLKLIKILRGDSDLRNQTSLTNTVCRIYRDELSCLCP